MGIDVWRNASEVKQYEDTNLRPNDPTVRSQSEADLRMPIPPHYGSPQRTCHPLNLLHPLGRIIGIRITNGTPRDVAVTRLMPHPPSNGQARDDPYAHQDLAIYDLCKRVRHLIGTCDNYSIFINQELWHQRARGCVETAASLVVCADIKPELFGDLRRLLHPLYQSVGRYHTAPGSDGLFSVRLDCLSLVIINRGMAVHGRMKLDARVAIDILSQFGMEDGSEQTNDGDGDENALRNARRIDNCFETARQFCVYGLRGAFRPEEVGTTEEQVKEVLARDHKDDISMLERIALATDRVAIIDRAIFGITGSIRDFAGGLILNLHGVYLDVFEQTELIQPIRFFNPSAEHPTFLPQFIFLHQRLRLLCSYSSKLRDIIDGRGNGAYKEMLESLGTLWSELDNPERNWSGVRKQRLMERQLWRLQDFRDGGGFGFWIEFFFLVTQQHLYISLSPDAHSALILGTFRAITSNWRQHKHSIGTQRVILNLICDMAIFDRGLMSDAAFPRDITDELMVLLENMVDGQSGSHIDDAMKELDDAIKAQDALPGPERWWAEIRRFRGEAVKVLSRSRAPAPSS